MGLERKINCKGISPKQVLAIRQKKYLMEIAINEGLHWGIVQDYKTGIFRAELSKIYFPGEGVKIAKGVISEILRLVIPKEERKELVRSHRKKYGNLMVKDEIGVYNKDKISEYIKSQGKISWYERNGSKSRVEVAYELSQKPEYITKTGKVRWRLIAKKLEEDKHWEDTKVKISADMTHRAVKDYKKRINNLVYKNS